MSALRSSRRKVGVFLGTVLILVLIIGSAMYLVEGAEHGFTSIPRAVYWAVVTLTTVGYGDITPQTVLGQVLAALVMIIGYAIIAVPTGIVSAELVHARRPDASRGCPACETPGHEAGARFCKDCGEPLDGA
jgi:voltage-gated potassium channel